MDSDRNGKMENNEQLTLLQLEDGRIMSLTPQELGKLEQNPSMYNQPWTVWITPMKTEGEEWKGGN